MQGRLTNTATGQTIALVEGVELARSLTFETAASRKAAAAGKRQKELRNSEGGGKGVPSSAAFAGVAAAEAQEPGGELEVDKELKPGMWTAFGALASSKFFMYKARTICIGVVLQLWVAISFLSCLPSLGIRLSRVQERNAAGI